MSFDIDDATKQTARQFHELYEKYAPEFCYETRPDTKELDFESPNGKLMLKVCKLITLNSEIEKLEARIEDLIWSLGCDPTYPNPIQEKIEALERQLAELKKIKEEV
jgi:hypothetical protein